jgi:ribonuclease HI
MTESAMIVKIYTDGACKGNPGRGGYAAILVQGEHVKELSGGFLKTTNNRMEMMAAIAGLRALKKRCKVALYSDSQYLVNAMSKGWTKKWHANGWLTSTKEPVKNIDLWKDLIELCAVHHVSFLWVRGHAGHEYNERCDELAVAASKKPQLPADDKFLLTEKSTELSLF